MILIEIRNNYRIPSILQNKTGNESKHTIIQFIIVQIWANL